MRHAALLLVLVLPSLAGCAWRERRSERSKCPLCAGSAIPPTDARDAGITTTPGTRLYAGPIVDGGHWRGDARLRLEPNGGFTWEQHFDSGGYLQVRARGSFVQTPDRAVETRLDAGSRDRVRIARVETTAIEVELEVGGKARPRIVRLPLVFETGKLTELVMLFSFRNDSTDAESAFSARRARSVLAEHGILSFVEVDYSDAVLVFRRDVERARSILASRGVTPSGQPATAIEAR